MILTLWVWVTVQARGRVAELLDELRQTVGGPGGPGWGSYTQYVYGISISDREI